MPLGFIKDYYDNKRAIASDARKEASDLKRIDKAKDADIERINWNAAAADDAERRRLDREIEGIPRRSSAMDQELLNAFSAIAPEGQDPTGFAQTSLAKYKTAPKMEQTAKALQNVANLETAAPFQPASIEAQELGKIAEERAKVPVAQFRGQTANAGTALIPSSTRADMAVNNLQERQADSSAMDVDAVRSFQAIKRGAEEAGIARNTRLTQKSDEMGLDTQALMTQLAELQAAMKTAGLMSEQPERSREFHPPVSDSGFNRNSIDGANIPTSSQGPRGGSTTNRAVGTDTGININDLKNKRNRVVNQHP